MIKLLCLVVVALLNGVSTNAGILEEGEQSKTNIGEWELKIGCEDSDEKCVVKKCPFSQLQFVQGLEVFEDGEHMVVSSGWYGFSRIVVFKYDFDDCLFYKTFEEYLEPKYFAEGVTRIGDQFYQITWREKRIFIWQIKGKYMNKLEKIASKNFPRFHRIH